MKKYILLLFCSSVLSQNPFSKEYPNNILAIKGCGYINLLDGGFGSIIGLEKSYFKNHSIGAKFIYNAFTPHREDTANNYEPIDYSKDKDISYIIEYKYYFDFNIIKDKAVIPYFSISYKNGKRTFDNDVNYPHDFYHRETKYNLFGPAIGTLVVLGESKKWTIDTQIGYLLGNKNRKTEYVFPIQFNQNDIFNTDLFRFEIMLTYTIDL
ncbi:hypothetical protein Q361_11139 [Flavobacterium croceum DSM 17960]|uniref:Outer membrane protein with beta-barrel domain n=1 Tax=Flavobacterium croceum DSM 17960 TaxID=1121886 RepID=A0A2S4N6I4_9FLAO|nr:hypothetical protein [Flavobacterium croceum]POS01328.1 hypothetical protein Q361_11139 [Flavobacterium croceum DSM 17960]